MNKLLLTSIVSNGGPTSGNHSPGQGRGVGKPSNGSGIINKNPKIKAGKVSHQKYAYDVKDWDSDDYRAKKEEFVAEWDETNHPFYPDTIIIKSETQIGVVPNRDEWSKSRRAYYVRDKDLMHVFTADDDDYDRDYVKEYLSKTFNLSESELNKLLDNAKSH